MPGLRPSRDGRGIITTLLKVRLTYANIIGTI